jgi:hypothetical protein
MRISAAAALGMVATLATVASYPEAAGSAASRTAAFQFPGQLKLNKARMPMLDNLTPSRKHPTLQFKGPSRLRLRESLRMVQRPSGKAARESSTTTFSAVRDAIELGTVSDIGGIEDMLRKTPIPQHPRIMTGTLPNGLEYSILPNSNPAGRFECHLEIFAGSADELQSQQGMAHMCEHVSYMGSRKRERLFGSSSQTNAQTDFHHTVYWAGCPTLQPSTGKPMLPLALDALLDVMEAKFEPSRVEKERSAILSEAAMVNTIDYRVEVQLLSALHAENRLHRRFPIGLIDQISSWTSEEVPTSPHTTTKPTAADGLFRARRAARAPGGGGGARWRR